MALGGLPYAICLSRVNLYFTEEEREKKTGKNKMRIYFVQILNWSCVNTHRHTHARESVRHDTQSKKREKTLRVHRTKQHESGNSNIFYFAQKKNSRLWPQRCAHINMGPTYFVNNFVYYPRARARATAHLDGEKRTAWRLSVCRMSESFHTL